ncbi:Esterase OVCA2, partial [Mucuna pruriens]
MYTTSIQDLTEHVNLEECISYVCEYMMANGPFDGFLGSSQGAKLSALLIGYQAQARSKFGDAKICDVAYKDTIKVKSVHVIGDKDRMKLLSEELASAFDKPLIIKHPYGHIKLNFPWPSQTDELATSQLRNWIEEVLQTEDGVLVCKHGMDHEEKRIEQGSKN